MPFVWNCRVRCFGQRVPWRCVHYQVQTRWIQTLGCSEVTHGTARDTSDLAPYMFVCCVIRTFLLMPNLPSCFLREPHIKFRLGLRGCHRKFSNSAEDFVLDPSSSQGLEIYLRSESV